MKNILIISSTPRKNGNSEVLDANFAKGATEFIDVLKGKRK